MHMSGNYLTTKNKNWSNGGVAEGGTLLRCYVEQSASRVQIPITPFFIYFYIKL